MALLFDFIALLKKFTISICIIHFFYLFLEANFMCIALMKEKTKMGEILQFYLDGFRSMKVGKVLWVIIFIKLFIMFFILKLFFFPDFLSTKTSDSGGKGNYVASELIQRSIKP